MPFYDMSHPTCGAKWSDFFDLFPKSVRCRECGEWSNAVYSPIIYAINAQPDKQSKHRMAN